MNLFNTRGLKCFISPTNHITGFWANEMAEFSVQQSIRIRWLQLRPRPNNIVTESSLVFWVFWDHDDVHLWEMRHRIYREEKPDQASKDPCIFFTDLFLWGMRQSSVEPTPESGPQIQLDLRSMWSLFQHTGQPSTPSCPARETSSTWIRTQPKAATYRVTTNKYPPRKALSCSRHGGSTWRPRDQSLE